MKRWKLWLLCGWLVLVAVMVCGCDKPYLPADFAENLDIRIAELKRAQELYPQTECQKVIGSDLEFLQILQEASR